MIPFDTTRLRRLEFAEVVWRVREAAETTAERVMASLAPPTWKRSDLARVLARHADLNSVRAHLTHERWREAHVALSKYVQAQPARFVIAPGMRQALAEEITRRFPASVADAAARGDRLLDGRYDLLGYQDIRFDGRSWHTDVVHNKSAPLVFWSKVPYLHPECGDHKVTWEFNRHQHWMELGRAYWLTGDARYRRECIRQLESWLETNPPLMGMNWASMLEIAFRSLSWLWAANFFAEGAEDDQSPWLVDLLLGLDRQLAHVERHLSYYFSPNTHLLGEAMALYIAGRSLPALKASARREAIGRRVLLQEIGRQIAADGGHCERSTHYHRYTLDFYLLALAVARLTDDPVAGAFEKACARLAQAARVLADDDGILPHIGDDDGGSLLPLTRRATDDVRDSLAMATALTGRVDWLVDDPPEEVWWVLGHPRFADAIARMGRAPKHVPQVSAALHASGYYVSRNERGDHLVVDGGSHGYLNGGHAHADALSLTFTVRRRPLLIDTGTGCYTIHPRIRDRFRSSDLHNTLTLNARSQSVPRGPFHWQHMADATTRRWRTNPHFDYFAGTHGGYAPLGHYRHVLMLHEDVLVVADCVTAIGKTNSMPAMNNRADVHWHLAPDWSVETRDTTARFTAAGDVVELHVAGGAIEHFRGDDTTDLGWHAPVYGRIEPTSTIRIAAEGAAPLWVVSVFGLNAANRVRHVSMHTVDGSGDVLHYATAIRIEREQSVDRVLIAEPRDDRRPGQWRTGDIVTDARLLYAREAACEVAALALVDATLLRSERHPHLDRNFPTRVADLWAPGAWGVAPEKRKAS